jgi:hypothetical protein
VGLFTSIDSHDEGCALSRDQGQFADGVSKSQQQFLSHPSRTKMPIFFPWKKEEEPR